MKFTSTSIKALKPKAERYEVWEDNRQGFGIRVSPTGRKSWIFLYRFQGKPRRMTLGVYPTTSLATAHKKHGDAAEALDKGIDPGAAVQNKKAIDRQAPTISQLIDEYIDKWAKPRKRSWKEDKRLLMGPDDPTKKSVDSVADLWGKRKAKDITRRDIILLLDDIVDRGSPITANRTFAVIRKMFNFAMSRDIIETTPCAAIKSPAKEKARERILSADEIKTFWDRLDNEKVQMSQAVKIALKLELVTAQRKAEIIGARKSEIDFKEKWWTITGSRTKNGLPHRVPLSPLAIELFTLAFDLASKMAQRQKREDIWVFPSKYTNTQTNEDAVDRALRRNIDEIGVASFTPHDLRRTAASQMTSMGISRLTVGKLLNHAESGVTAVYDRHSYDSEKQNAIEQWNTRLEKILAPTQNEESNIILLPMTNTRHG